MSTFLVDVVSDQFKRRSNMKYEVHLLAYFYHWDAASIMKMPIRERGEWCDILKAQIYEENKKMK